MHDNIRKVIERNGKIEDLRDRADVLEGEASKFEKCSRYVRVKMDTASHNKYCIYGFAVAVFVIVVVCTVVLITGSN